MHPEVPPLRIDDQLANAFFHFAMVALTFSMRNSNDRPDSPAASMGFLISLRTTPTALW